MLVSNLQKALSSHALADLVFKPETWKMKLHFTDRSLWLAKVTQQSVVGPEHRHRLLVSTTFRSLSLLNVPPLVEAWEKIIESISIAYLLKGYETCPSTPIALNTHPEPPRGTTPSELQL